MRLLGALLVIYLGYPLLAFAVRISGGGSEGWHVPGLFSALQMSVIGASASLLIGVLGGIPLAHLLARRDSLISRSVGVIVQLPLAVPPLISGILLIYIVGPYTFLGRLSGQRLTETIWGLIIAQSFVSVPFLVVVARSSFQALDPALDEVAATLGHGPLARFLRVDVPAASDGIRTGMILCWLRAFGEYGTTVVLAYHPYSLPVYVDNLFTSAPLSQAQAPTALAFAVAAIAIAALSVRRLPHRRPAPPPAAREPARTRPLTVAFSIDASAGSFHLRACHRGRAHRLAILGPSGSGKSLTLRTLAGLLGPHAGRVSYGGVEVSDVPAERRRVGYVPQGLGLLPGRSVWQQVNFGTRADPQLAAWWLATLHLDALTDRRPAELSGGQRQRVSLARALATEPDVVLLDEPFSALDVPVRDELRRELRRLQHDAGISTVLVTHDPQEAAFLADEIVVLIAGQVAQSGSVAELYRHPASPQVARLLGFHNLARGVIAADGSLRAGSVSLPVASALPAGSAVSWSIAPARIRVACAGTAAPASLMPDATSAARGSNSCTPCERIRPALSAPPPPAHHALVADLVDLGTSVELTLRLQDGPELLARSSELPALTVGQTCLVTLDPDAVIIWPAGAALAGAAPAGAAHAPAAIT